VTAQAASSEVTLCTASAHQGGRSSNWFLLRSGLRSRHVTGRSRDRHPARASHGKPALLCPTCGRRRLKDTRAFVVDPLRHRLFPLKSGQLLQEPLVQALELLVRLLCFGSAMSFASQGLDRDALARQRCFFSRHCRLEQSYPRGNGVMHPCSNAERAKR